jgi:hypothetical protein
MPKMPFFWSKHLHSWISYVYVDSIFCMQARFGGFGRGMGGRMAGGRGFGNSLSSSSSSLLYTFLSDLLIWTQILIH